MRLAIGLSPYLRFYVFIIKTSKLIVFTPLHYCYFYTKVILKPFISHVYFQKRLSFNFTFMSIVHFYLSSEWEYSTFHTSDHYNDFKM